jgi:4-hydroxybenzoate polyprenyltransferase
MYLKQKQPICVDLDGTLTFADTFFETLILFIKKNPIKILKVFIWLFIGKAYLKKKLAESVHLDPKLLPYNFQLIEWLRLRRNSGHKIILCTGSDFLIANSISNYLGFFDLVIASDGYVNLTGKNKANLLSTHFGDSGFIYVGNSYSDLYVWNVADKIGTVNFSSILNKYIFNKKEVVFEFNTSSNQLINWAKELRIYQWLKNLLLFAPFFAAHRFYDLDTLVFLFIAFLAFCLNASAIYIINDLFDLESDRRHPHKHKRPIASGSISIYNGFFVSFILLAASFLLALSISFSFLFFLLIYFFITNLYTLKLKQLILIDCFVLALLYTLRILIGNIIINLQFSFWLLSFSIFLFLSLAFVKRYNELLSLSKTSGFYVHGRGYQVDDLSMIRTFGICSGFVAVLVFSLYLNSADVLRLYTHPEWLWGSVVVLLFWINWVWLSCHRDKIQDDPIIFAVKDRVSLLCGVMFLSFFFLGSLS